MRQVNQMSSWRAAPGRVRIGMGVGAFYFILPRDQNGISGTLAT